VVARRRGRARPVREFRRVTARAIAYADRPMRIARAMQWVGYALVAGCAPMTSTPPVDAGGADPVARWIQTQASPLPTVEPETSDADLQPFLAIAGDATIVGLGEATHGTHEFFAMKSRILEFLVDRAGATTFALENGWAASQPMAAYVATGAGDPTAL